LDLFFWAEELETLEEALGLLVATLASELSLSLLSEEELTGFLVCFLEASFWSLFLSTLTFLEGASEELDELAIFLVF